MLNLNVPLPPVSHWIRATQAAQRLGLPQRALLHMVESDPLMRVQHLGARRLTYLALEDVERLSKRLSQQGGPR